MMTLSSVGQEQFVCCQSLGEQPTADPGTINGDALDRFTLAHAASGAVAGALKSPWWATLAGALLWELVERPLKNKYPEAFPNSSQDTVPNAICDVAAIMVGWGAAQLIFHRN